MNFKWEKQGLIFKAAGQFEWMQSYTTPIAAIVLVDKIRIFITTRSTQDKNGNFISYSSFIDVEKDNPSNIIYIHDKPIIDLGVPGTFDEFGVMVAKPVTYNNKIYLYYMGWQRLTGLTAPYQVALGLAISNDQGYSFEKVSQGPVLGIDYFDPISIGNVSVIVDENVWKMWYTSYVRWNFDGIKPTPEYNIKYAESLNGINWQKKNIVAIEQHAEGVATPSVIKFHDKYAMWFSYRKPYDSKGSIGKYKIGYAWSNDGILWNRDDNKSIITTSESGWDSEMICYPHVIEVNNRLLMFYCGNEFGKSGFGYALLKDSDE